LVAGAAVGGGVGGRMAGSVAGSVVGGTVVVARRFPFGWTVVGGAVETVGAIVVFTTGLFDAAGAIVEVVAAVDDVATAVVGSSVVGRSAVVAGVVVAGAGAGSAGAPVVVEAARTVEVVTARTTVEVVTARTTVDVVAEGVGEPGREKARIGSENTMGAKVVEGPETVTLTIVGVLNEEV
jgi:hypothetical protein